MVKRALAFILAVIFALPIGSQVFVRRAVRIPASSGPLAPTLYESWEGDDLLVWTPGGAQAWDPDYSAAPIVGSQSLRNNVQGFGYYSTPLSPASRTNWGSFAFIIDSDPGAMEPHFSLSRLGSGNDVIITLRKPGATVMRAHAGSSSEWVDGTTTIHIGVTNYCMWQYIGGALGQGDAVLNVWLNTNRTELFTGPAEIAITGGDSEQNSDGLVFNQTDSGTWRTDELKYWNGAADPR